MNLFKRNEPAAPEPVEPAGITALRRVVKARNSKGGALAAVAGMIDGLGLSQLEDFGDGKANLKIEIIKKLAMTLFPHSVYDAEAGLLRSANRTPARGFVTPPPFDATKSPHYFKIDPSKPVIGPQPVEPQPPLKKISRPGWL